MDKNISKVYSFNIDTKGKKVISKDIDGETLLCNASDSLDFIINLTEDGKPKQLGDNCKIYLISHIEYEDGSVIDIKQDSADGSISYEVLADKTIIKMHPKDSFNLGASIVDNEIVISDINENISAQHFKFKVNPSLNNKIVEESIDSINTLVELEEQILKNEVVLQITTRQAINMQKQVDDKCLEVTETLIAQDKYVDESIIEMNNKINNTITEIDTQVLKSIKLEVVDNFSTDNYIYYATKLITMKAEELINKAFDVHVGGYVANESTFQTSLGMLNFYIQNNNLYADFMPLLDRNIGGSSVSVEILFSNKLNYIPKSVRGYKIIIKTKLAKSLNKGNEFAYLTPKSDSRIEWGRG